MSRTPLSPQVVSLISVSGADVAVAGGHAYVVNAGTLSARGLHTIDVSDPFNPVEVDYQPMVGFRTVEVSGSTCTSGDRRPASGSSTWRTRLTPWSSAAAIPREASGRSTSRTGWRRSPVAPGGCRWWT